MAITPPERKNLRLTDPEIEELKRIADARDVSVSEQVRIWTEQFLKDGTTAPSKETRQLTLLIPKELSEAAERKAAAEYGLTLRDVIRHRIGVIYDRP